MSQRKVDNNDLAQLLDKSSSEEKRSSTRAQLADSDADLEVLGDAAFLLDDLEEEAAPAHEGAEARPPHVRALPREPVTTVTAPPSTRRGWRRAPARWLALAAMLAGVLLVPLALSRSGSRGPGDFAALLASRDAGFPADGWSNRSRWSVTRGDCDVSADLPRAARLGALQVDLEVAAAAGQAAEIRQLSDDIVCRLDDMAGSGAVAAAYRDIAARADQPAETLTPSVAEARESLVPFVDEDHFSLGAWAEAAAIAAQRRDTGFFHARASRKMLDRAASLPSLDAETRATVAAIQAAAQADQPDWTVLAAQSDALLRHIAD